MHQPVATEGYRYPGFWVRSVAYSIDQIILYIASALLSYGSLYVLYGMGRMNGSMTGTFSESFSGGFIQIVSMIASLAISIPYYVAFIHLRGTTPGKRVMGIRVLDRETGAIPSLGQSVGRYFATILSAIILGAGYLMVAFHREKRALHDVLSGTINIYDSASEPNR